MKHILTLMFVCLYWQNLIQNSNGSKLLEPDLLDSPSKIGYKFEKEFLTDQHKSKLRLKKTNLYLPRNVIPTLYNIKIRPILQATDPKELFTAPGSVEIHFSCLIPTNHIVLHAQTKDFIKIQENTVKIETQSNFSETKTIIPLEHLYDEEDTDFYQIKFAETLIEGQEYSVYMEFITKIQTDSLRGLYLSKYKDPSSQETKLLAVTQFEDIYARQMFPCLDEPDLKASFQITISRLDKYNSMSNMPLARSEPDPEKEGYFLDHYHPTPPMSSYIVALVVSEFSCKAAHASIYVKPTEACGPKHMIEELDGGSHAANVSARILRFYDELFLQKYPFPKMQSVAIPDFEAGAMENYGLNTYRINALLYFPGITTETGRKRIESVIAHELAHQNFGNLVTTKTWNHIFLNEGFAEYVSYLGASVVGPEFRNDLSWYVEYVQRALRKDAFIDTHPVVKVDDYFGDFDAITYSKGASLIKMMENILTYETLITGLRNYLATFSFGNAEYSDLLDVLDAQALDDKTHPAIASLQVIMENWLVKPGFPLIRVEQVMQRVYHISQERFIHVVQKDSSSKNKTFFYSGLWFCPIFITTSDNFESEKSNSRPKLWLTTEQSIKAWSSKSNLDWMIVNPNSAGYFRVLYDETLSNAIHTQLNTNSQVFSPIVRAQLIDDAFECSWAKYSPIDVALNRTIYLSQERDANVWFTAVNHFNKIYQMLSEDPVALPNFNNFLASRIAGALAITGVEQLNHEKGEIVIQRKTLIAWGGTVGVYSVGEYSRKLIEEWKAFPKINPVPIDIQEEIYCFSIRHGNKQAFDFIRTKYFEEINGDQKRLLLKGLTCSTDLKTLQSLLHEAINSGSGINKNDGFILLQKLLGNSLIRLDAYWFLRQNFNEILNYFGSSRAFSTFLDVLSHYWNTEEKLVLMKEFINEHEVELLEPSMESVKSVLYQIEENIEWIRVHGKSIQSWLAKQPENIV